MNRSETFHERVAKQIMNLALSTPERWAHQVKKATEAGFLSKDADMSYESMKKFVAEENYTISVPNERQIALEVATFDKLLPLIFRRGWVLLKAPKDSGGFVTSDHPVCLTTVGGAPSIAHRPGYGLRSTEVLFPLSPKLALVGAFETSDGEAEIEEDMVAIFNGTVATFAERQVYARDYHFHYAFREGEPYRKASKLVSDPKFLRATDYVDE